MYVLLSHSMVSAVFLCMSAYIGILCNIIYFIPQPCITSPKDSLSMF